MGSGPRDEELFFKCSKCGSLFSTTKSALEQDRYLKASVTSILLGGKVSPLAGVPKCTRCSTKLDRIPLEEFNQLMERPPP
jgi:DNA-directed RNA polymerase subunit RPC12/RpoP